MSTKILLVDDEANVLDAFRRQLRKRYEMETAQGADEALAAVAERGPFAVVVSDMQMPGKNGVQLLAEIRELAPDTVRVMLTGNADQGTAVEAVNAGSIFRFLNKPCSSEMLAGALDAALEQHRLITAEHELLSKTLCGSVALLTEVLSLVNPTAFGRAGRIRRLARQICERMSAPTAWQIEIAAMLSQIGCVTVPESVLSRYYSGAPLRDEERKILDNHPQIGRQLVAKIPRLESVSRIIAAQDERFDERTADANALSPDEALGSNILKVVNDYETLCLTCDDVAAINAMRFDRPGAYNPEVLKALSDVVGVGHDVRLVAVDQLEIGMLLDCDALSAAGELLVASGHEVTESMLVRLKNYNVASGVRQPLRVRCRIDDEIEQSPKALEPAVV